MSEPLSDPPNRDVRGLAESASIGIHVRDEHPGDFVACRDGMCVEARRLLAASERPSWRELSRAMLADGTAEAAASERPPVDPLREAAQRLLEVWPMSKAREEARVALAAALASAAAPRPEGLPDEERLHSAMAGHTITPECGPICWTTGHHHDPEACDGCRRLMDMAYASAMGDVQNANEANAQADYERLSDTGEPTDG